MYRTTKLFVCLFCAASGLAAADFYASPTGLSTGTGSIASPWDLATALNRPASVHAGDTIYLRGGTHSTALNWGTYRTSVTGTAALPITIRPYGVERAIIDGGVSVDTGYLIFRDLEVTSTSTNRISNQNTTWPTDVVQQVGFSVYAPGVKIINNVVHDVLAGINSWIQGSDSEVYGNIVYYNGWWSTQGGAHGHGVYAQNQTGRKAFTDNIVFSHFDHGLHFYGSGAAALNNFDIIGNVAFNNGNLGLYYSRNILVGGGITANNPVIRNNYMYYSPSSTLGGDHNIGYDPGGAGCTSLVMENNYWVAGGWAMTLYNCTVTSFTGNTFHGQWRGVSPGSYPGNTFHALDARPTGVLVFVRPNLYETGRSHVVILNWDRVDSVNVDLSATGLVSGDLYEVRDVQNYFGAPIATGTYLGGAVAIPVTSMAIAAPVGNVPYPPAHTDKEFQTYVVRKVGAGPPPPPPPDTVAPTAPGSLTATPFSSSQINLSWAASTDSVGVTGYLIERCQAAGCGSFAQIAAPSGTGTTYSNTGLSASTSYSYRVRAKDAANNLGGYSPVASAVTPAPPPPPDTTLPVVTVTSPTGGQTVSGVITLAANASDNVGVVSVQFKVDGVNVGSADTTSPYTAALDTNTLANGSHTITAVAVDAAANSKTSVGVVVTVNNVPPPPPGVTYVYLEAENGVLVTPMYMAQWGLASNGKYVRATVLNQGTATLTFTVPTAGTYVFWGRVFSQDSNKDSFHVSVDGGSEDIWDTAQGTWSSAWQWTRVTGRIDNGGTPSPLNANPREFTLTAGQHTIRFRGADTYTYLDRVLLTNDTAFVPVGMGQ